MESGITGLSYHISPDELQPGEHLVSVTANGVGTIYRLCATEFDQVLDEPVPVKAEHLFIVK